tara:strand:+ start:2509 stop:4881 length:2373 start_codon:yes stop_codon:yes gene_type:complete
MAKDSVTTIRQLPKYMQEYDEALLQRIFGTPTKKGNLKGGLINDPDLFNIPDYVQAGRNPLQESVVNSFGTDQQRQSFMDRYQPYFTDASGNARYLPEAGQGLGAGASTIANSLQNYFPEAQNYLRQGAGGIGAKGIYDNETLSAKYLADQSLGSFDARGRGDSLYSDAINSIQGGRDVFGVDNSSYDAARSGILGGQGEFDVNSGQLREGTGEFEVDSSAYDRARSAIESGQGGFDVNSDQLRKGTGTYNINESRFNEGRDLMRGAQGQYGLSGGLGDARDALREAGEGEFGARDAFERGTGRAFELAEQGLGRFDPASATQSFMDPYKTQVIDAAMSRIDREAAKKQQSDAARAISAGAFGGSRSGVQAAETARAIDETKQNTIANLMSQGYDKALSSAMSTDEAARKRALQASGLTGQLGSTGASLESRSFEDAAKRGLAAASSSAGLSQTEEQLRSKAFENARSRGLTGAQLSNAVAETMNKLGMSSFESGAARTMNAEQIINQAKMKAFEAGKARGLTGAQLESSVAQAEQNARQSAFESGAGRTMNAEQMINNARQKAFESGKARGLTGAQLESSISQAVQNARQSAFESGEKRQQTAGTAMGSIAGSRLGAESQSFEAGQQRLLKAADMYRSMGLSSAEAQTRAAEDQRKRNLETGRLMGGLGSSSAQIGGAQADIGKAYGALAGTSADIGQVYAGMAPKDLGFMYEIGGKEQQYDQQVQDFYRQNQLAATQQALAPYSYAQNFLTGAPSASMYSEYSQAPSTAPNPFLQGVGMYATYQGANR